MPSVPDNLLPVGQINGVFGVHGWVKIYSDTEPRENIFSYSPWWIQYQGEWREVKVEGFKGQQGGKALVAKLDLITERDMAREFMGCPIAIDRDALQQNENEFFWVDLIGCQVVNLEGDNLGSVVNLIETGAHDVLRVQGDREVLIPFVMERFILDIDTTNKLIKVDWLVDEDEQSE
ncbi:ribosome maturation factor RimM [Thiosulfatimonas sediminis]|uniref:Ribosome maturation factor RimM n=1 Tax=Thiosulfatimonas sediminis TaxID=2675054 RepID=A0A6F8PT82_9GAMM|nr:ribosome maturation factor RimM [Thiosulfatimonas sediminis]BBP45325.1 ribosome maturation factor RimM [Thiosulfatimonas sediminis]